MNYLYARFANAENTAAIVHTDVSGDVVLSQVDTPAEWDEMLGLIVPEPYAVQNPVPPIISDRQFFQQLAVEGKITEDEAIDAVAIGVIPPLLQTFVDSLPPDQQFGAKMLLKGATEFRRDHPMSAAVGGFMGMTGDEVDDFFRSASLL